MNKVGCPPKFSPLERELKRKISARQRKKRWRKRHPEKHVAENLKRATKRWHDSPVFRLSGLLRNRIYCSTFRYGRSKLTKSSILLGCSAQEYKRHIESLFLPGMSWANYSKWHIDHIKPISSFDLTTLEGQKAAFHYTNTQPLWAVDNLRKGSKVL
jgi:hypothetical protein